MAEVSQEADAFAFWCLSDIYNQGGFQSSEFQGNYGMMSLHGLRKPAWFAHSLLGKVGRERLPCFGGSELVNAVVTRKEDGTLQILVYAYPARSGDQPAQIDLSVVLPANVKSLSLTRIGAEENNIISSWRAMGSPAYPTCLQISALLATNQLTLAEPHGISTRDGKAKFAIECPGVALLEIS